MVVARWPLLLLAVLALMLPGCLVKVVEENATSGPSGQGTDPPGVPTFKAITMHDGQYDPDRVTIAYNGTLQFIAEQGTHSIASTNGVYDQGDVPEGSSVSMWMNLAGTYTMQCRFHAGMRMTVTVVPA